MPANSQAREIHSQTMRNKNKTNSPRINDRIMTNDNHSKLDKIHETTDLDRCNIPERLRPHTVEYELHKEGGEYGKESIMKKRTADVYGGARRAVDLKFKLHKWTGAIGRTMGLRVRAAACFGLLLTMLVTCHAAPSRARVGRSTHNEKSVRNYLETFGYLRKGQPEVGNLLMGDVSQSYEDDFRIAIKTLQEFGGIPVTGEVDSATKHLMRQKRCGRPDREADEGRRHKRFAVQGEKWKHTNLTWSMSSSLVPSQLDLYETRHVLARALDVWQQASRLTFTEVNSDEADIVVSFARRNHGDAYPFDGRGSILAHAFFPGSGRGGDAHFDDDELWLLQPKNDDEEGTSLFAVAAHEFGHSLGLSHSSSKGALMFPWYQGIQPNFVLPEDDRNGIQQMYGPKDSRRLWDKIPNYRPAETPPPTTTTTTTTTTTRRPHHRRHPSHPESYPRNPSKYPMYPDRSNYPNRPNYPDRTNYPDKPHHPDRTNYYPTYYPDHRHHNSSDDYPKRPHQYPRITPETTTRAATYRPPRYPTTRPEYPTYPKSPSYHPNHPNRHIPKTKPHLPERTTVRPTPPSDKPDTCNTSYDAVALIRGELFIFKNRYHWRIGKDGRYPQYPIEISRMWPDLPSNLTHVDAVYERPDKKIAFFVGRKLYLFNSQYLVPGYPKPLTHFGLPESLEKIDAAMVWGHNEKTYFYSGTMYWKYDEEVGKVEPDYPRDMSMWKGVGYNIDSVFQWKDGKTYFFKGRGFWKFNDLQMRVEHERQLPSSTFWMGCPGERAGRRAPFRSLPAPGSTLRSPSAAHSLSPNHLVTIASVLLLLISHFKSKN